MFHRNLITLSLVLLSFTARSEMDCDAMFQESEAKLAANKNLIAAEKVKLYEMAIKAYQQCEQGNEKMASDLFDQIFDTSDRM